jgi:DNA-binding transcriptional ArsR family regulator
MSNPEQQSVLLGAAPIFAALGDRTRLSLLKKLSTGGSQSIARLSVDTHLTRQAVTKHLRVLEDAGLVRVSRIGRESQYVFQPEPIAAARTYLDDVSQQWSDALERLKTFVELRPDAT